MSRQKLSNCFFLLFFFEKKNQKTFASPEGHRQMCVGAL
jgi:hypothetical protein